METSQNKAGLRLSPVQLIVGSFALMILTGTVLLRLPAATNSGRLNPVDALFTATSAVCVTGLVVVDTGSYFTRFGQMVILLLIQIGGLGFMTVATLFFILLGSRIGLRSRLIMQEALNQFTLAGVIRLTKYIVGLTLLLEGIGAAILAFRFAAGHDPGTALFFGIFHAVSAFCNAGFDVLGRQYGEFCSFMPHAGDSTFILTLSSLFIFGGIGFSVIAEVVRKRNWRILTLHSKLVLAIAPLLLAAGTAVLFALEYHNPATLAPLPLRGKLLSAYFAAATPRTAGFYTINPGMMTTAGQFFTILLMFIGASPASTGGGIKTTTFGTLLLTLLALVRGRGSVEVYSKRLANDIVGKSLAIALLSLLLVILVTLLLLLTEAGHAGFLPVLFETVSAFGTVGLSTGITPHLSVAGKLLICLTMFAGRVGPLSLFLALTQPRRPASIYYPEEKILVG
ncbi:MAG: TrkH family potassium uptake protein [bacterium]|jgi:trk system potassium uptake protein TrkH